MNSSLELQQNNTRGPWWPWIAHLSHFTCKWILHLCSFGSLGVGPVLIPRGIIWINLTKVYKEMLHNKSLSSIPSSFREEEFWSWFSLFLCSNLWPWDGGQFWPHEHHMNKLGRGPQGDAKYQISKPLAIPVQRRRILKTGFFVPLFQLVTNLHLRAKFWSILLEGH